MNKIFSSLSVLTLTCLLNSCGELNKNSIPLIKGGKKVIDKNHFVYKTTVGISDVKYLEFKWTFCSGTIVSKRHILTAAHCLTENAQYPSTTTSDLRVVFGAKKVEPWKVLSVKAQAWHTNYIPNATTSSNPETPAPNDVAMLYLSEDIPEGFESIEMNFDTLYVGEQVTLAGYGTVYGTPFETTGVLRYTEQTLTSIDTRKHRIATANPRKYNAKGACPGDSGGPLFIERDGKMLVSGITSIVSTSFLGMYCKAWNAYTNIADYKTFIDLAMSNINEEQANYITFQ